MRGIRNNLMLGVFIMALTACDKTIDSTDDVCTGDCTTIKGRIVSRNNAPISGVSLSFKHTTSSPGSYSHTIRKIRTARTDENGNYEMKFHLEDGEVGYPGTGYFQLTVDRKSVNASRFIVNPDFDLEATYYTIEKRDTVIDGSIYFPEKSSIKVNLKGFKPIDKYDRFEVQSFWPYGFKENAANTFLGTIYGTGSSQYGALVANSDNYSTAVVVAKGDTNVIRVSRIKNGVGGLFEERKFFVPDNNNIELTFDW